MSEQRYNLDRRIFLKAAVSAGITTGIAGCSEEEGPSAQTQITDQEETSNRQITATDTRQVTDNKTPAEPKLSFNSPLDGIIEPTLLYQNAVDRESSMLDDASENSKRQIGSFDSGSFVSRPADAYEAISETAQRDWKSHSSENPALEWMIPGKEQYNIQENRNSKGNISLTAFDSTDILSRLEDSGDLQAYETDFNTYKWNVFKGEAVDKYRIGSPKAEFLKAVKGNTTVTVPKFEQGPRYHLINDLDAAMEIALDTYIGEEEELTKGDDYGSQTAAELQEFLENPNASEVDNWPIDNPQEHLEEAQVKGCLTFYEEEPEWEEMNIKSPGIIVFRSYDEDFVRHTPIRVYNNGDMEVPSYAQINRPSEERPAL